MDYSGAVAALITWEQALEAIFGRVHPLPSERVPLSAAAGRVTAAPVTAQVDLPPFDSSAMDGYAVRAADTPGTLPVVAAVAAGRPAAGPLAAGEAMEISTGGVVPEGADAVIPVEYVVPYDNNIEAKTAVEPGAHIRVAGGDVRRGEVVVPGGARLGPAQVGALAAAGTEAVVCSARPRAAVIATGSELRPPGAPLAPGQIYEANGALLVAQLASAGADARLLPTVEDDAAAHRLALAKGLEHDVLLTTGGVSVGPHDLVRSTLAGLGVEEVFWGVSVKPGKPLSFGVRGTTFVFGLPGNPVSALVGFELFVRPALAALQGAAEPGPHWESGRLAEATRRNRQRDELVRATVEPAEGGPLLRTLPARDSHMIVRAAGADALVLVPHGEGELAAGAPARFVRLP